MNLLATGGPWITLSDGDDYWNETAPLTFCQSILLAPRYAKSHSMTETDRMVNSVQIFYACHLYQIFTKKDYKAFTVHFFSFWIFSLRTLVIV